ncbi:MAG: hypothetical protein HY908_24875 [Myxococcales bacterium]|nr:hypothetical protein [Myxococcales bacterium]
MDFRRERFSHRLHPKDGELREDWRFVECEVDGSTIAGHAPSAESYPRFRRCVLDRCKLGSCGAHAVRFDDCSMTECKWNGLVILDECIFSHVVLAGKLGELNIIAHHLDPRATYAGIDWALDIRNASSKSLTIMGIPARAIRHDPRLHGVITKERVAAVPEWKKLVGRSMAGLVIADLLDDDRADDILYIANPGPRHAKYLEELALLREVGLAE